MDIQGLIQHKLLQASEDEVCRLRELDFEYGLPCGYAKYIADKYGEFKQSDADEFFELTIRADLWNLFLTATFGDRTKTIDRSIASLQYEGVSPSPFRGAYTGISFFEAKKTKPRDFKSVGGFGPGLTPESINATRCKAIGGPFFKKTEEFLWEDCENSFVTFLDLLLPNYRALY